MQGMTNFTHDIASGMAWMLPTACYVMAVSCFIFSLWTLYQRYSGGAGANAAQARPWLPYVSMVMSGVFASFNVILTKTSASFGTDVTIGLADGLTGYGPAGNLLGGTGPKDAILTIVTDFAFFFQMFGAWCCFLAAMAWMSALRGRNNTSGMACFIRYVFGVLLLNPSTEATWLLNYWPS